jgi:ABC-2 type transport system ATP-binding protein
MTVLSIRDLTKTYGKVTALKNLNLDIEAGNIYGILGPNGSGKTTTLGIILGILEADSGTYEWFGGQYGDHHRLRIGSILETPNFYPYMSGYDNLKIVSMIRNVENPKLDELLRMVNLEDRAKSKFRAYSLGMKQRLAIAATLIGDPEVVIFDEPTNGLDPQGIAEVRQILQRIADSGKTVIMASHILDEVEKICSHVAIIKFGELKMTGPVGSIITNDYFIELRAQDQEALKTWILSQNFRKTFEEKRKHFEISVDAGFPVEEFNKIAYENGHILTHLVIRNRSLEEDFLEITA